MADNFINNLPRAAEYLLLQKQFPGFQYELNERQQEEKNQCIRQKFTVIQGPPGEWPRTELIIVDSITLAMAKTCLVSANWLSALCLIFLP